MGLFILGVFVGALLGFCLAGMLAMNARLLMLS